MLSVWVRTAAGTMNARKSRTITNGLICENRERPWFGVLWFEVKDLGILTETDGRLTMLLHMRMYRARKPSSGHPDATVSRRRRHALLCYLLLPT